MCGRSGRRQISRGRHDRTRAVARSPSYHHPLLSRSTTMQPHLILSALPEALSTTGLVTYLQGLFGPLFLGIVGIVAIFFLFTREIIRFIVLAVAIAVVFYTPSIVQTLAVGIAHALGVH